MPEPARAQDSDKLTLRQAVTLALQNSREIALAQQIFADSSADVLTTACDNPRRSHHHHAASPALAVA